MSADYWKKWPVPFTFLEPGDEATGQVVGFGDLREKWPEVHIRDGEGRVRIVRVTQTRLHELLCEQEPDVGDRIRIRFTGLGKAMPGMSAPKEFTVEIRRQGAKSTSPDSAEGKE